jgi:hypothetical protein
MFISVAREFTSNGLKFCVKVTPVVASSVRVTDFVVVGGLLAPPLEHAAIPRPRIIAAATPFIHL